MIKTNIKMRVTPEQSRRVQEICFKNGIKWDGELGDNILFSERPYLFILENLATANKSYDFENDNLEEIDADLFIKTNGTCILSDPLDICEDICNQLNKEMPESLHFTPFIGEETYLTKYTSQPKDLESALKKIENLHIALKKKVEKNKNQALEITRLLEQKKDLQDKLNQANRVIKIGIDNSSKLVYFLDKKDDIIKEKDTIISYLERKLK